MNESVYNPNNSTTEPHYLAIISEFAIDMLSLDSIEQVLWFVTKNVIGKLGFEDVVIYLYDAQKQQLIQKAAFGDKSSYEDEIVNPIEITVGHGVVGQAALTLAPVVIDDTRLFPAYIVDDKVRLSELAVPMIIDGKLFGVIDSEHSQTHFYNTHRQRVICAIASLVAIQISKINTVSQLKDTIENLEYSQKVQSSLFGITELIFETKSIDDFYRNLYHFISRLTFSSNFYVALLSEDKTSFVIQYRVDEVDDINETVNVEVPCKGDFIPSITGYALMSGEPLLVYENDIKQMVENEQFTFIGAIPKAWLGVPFGNKNLRGIVVVQSYLGGYIFTQKDKKLLTFVAKHIHNALERMRDKEKLEYTAMHDPLTGLPNRLLFTDRVTHAIAQTQRKRDDSLGICFLDVDKFKQVNDNYGHHIGDKLLVEVSKRIRSCLRASDTLCRLGGDEFAVLLEGVTQASDIMQIANNIINKVYRPIIIEHIELKISVSIGSAFFDLGDTSCSELLIQADEAMYKAKELGRNQVQLYHS